MGSKYEIFILKNVFIEYKLNKYLHKNDQMSRQAEEAFHPKAKLSES